MTTTPTPQGSNNPPFSIAPSILAYTRHFIQASTAKQATPRQSPPPPPHICPPPSGFHQLRSMNNTLLVDTGTQIITKQTERTKLTTKQPATHVQHQVPYPYDMEAQKTCRHNNYIQGHHHRVNKENVPPRHEQMNATGIFSFLRIFIT